MTTAFFGKVIQNEDAYNNAIKRNILTNANKTWRLNTERAGEIVFALGAGRTEYGYTDNFIGAMAAALDTYGKLSIKQSAAILKGIDAMAARKAEYAAKDATRAHYIHICEDAQANVIIYKGKADFPLKGETATIVATVKEHGLREGVKQTIIQRPKLAN